MNRARVQLGICAIAYTGVCVAILTTDFLEVGGMLSVPPAGALALGGFVAAHVALGFSVRSDAVCALPFLIPVLAYLFRAEIPRDSDIPEYPDVVLLWSIVAVLPALVCLAVGGGLAWWRYARRARSGFHGCE